MPSREERITSGAAALGRRFSTTLRVRPRKSRTCAVMRSHGAIRTVFCISPDGLPMEVGTTKNYGAGKQCASRTHARPGGPSMYHERLALARFPFEDDASTDGLLPARAGREARARPTTGRLRQRVRCEVLLRTRTPWTQEPRVVRGRMRARTARPAARRPADPAAEDGRARSPPRPTRAASRSDGPRSVIRDPRTDGSRESSAR